jgi:hypothetical protein
MSSAISSTPGQPGVETAPRPREGHGPTPFLTSVQQKEASRRRAQGATLQELAKSYNVGIPTIRRATRSA